MQKGKYFFVALICLLVNCIQARADGEIKPENMPSLIRQIDEGWIMVFDEDDFYHAVVDSVDPEGKHNAKIRILSDIDLSKIEASDDAIFDLTFSGSIDGCKMCDNKFDFILSGASKPIFKEMKDAQITNLVIHNGTLKNASTSGILAKTADNIVADNIFFSKITGNGNEDLGDVNEVGTAFGKLSNSTVSNIMFLDCKTITDGSAIGFVAAKAEKCTISGVKINGGCELWADGNIIYGDGAYVGGVVGMAEECTLKDCNNLGVISSDDNSVGGILGYGNNGTMLINCQNWGIVKHCTKDGYGRIARRDFSKMFTLYGFSSISSALVSYAFWSPGADAIVEEAENVAVPKAWYIKVKDAIVKYWNMDEVEFHDNLKAFLKSTAKSVIPSGLTGFATKQALTLDNEAYITQKFVLDRTFEEIMSRESSTQGNSQSWWTSPSGVSLELTGIQTVVSMLCDSNPFVGFVFGVGSILTSMGLNVYDNLTTPDEIGGIAGTLENNCQLIRCINTGMVKCADNDGGGIVGKITDSSVESCYNHSFVKGVDNTGGIAGYCMNSTIKGCLSVGPVSATGDNNGDISGKAEGSTVSDNYYMADAAKESSSATAFTQEQLPTGEIAKLLNEKLDSAIWHQDLGKDFYPVLNDTTRKAVTTTIPLDESLLVQKVYNIAEFFLAVSNPKAQISLQHDISLGSNYFKLSTKDHPFKGKIMGNGHCISGCTYLEEGIESGDKDNPNYAALFPYAEDASFWNLRLDSINIVQKHHSASGVIFGGSNFYGEAVLVGHSTNCDYSDITVSNSTILLNDDKDFMEMIGGLVAESSNDKFKGCTIATGCEFNAYVGIAIARNAYLGGIAGKSTNSTFTYCHNQGKISSDDNYDGGIVGYADGCEITSCLNTGYVCAQSYVGGIAGYGKNTKFTYCANTGRINDDEDKKKSHRAGIVGCLDGEQASISNCLNFGTIDNAGSHSGALEGETKNDATSAKNTNSFYYCQYNGENFNNENEYDDDSSFRYSKMLSGEFAGRSSYMFFQCIDGEPFCTNMPVPIPEAGSVNRNVLCDGTVTYSNLYSCIKAHESVWNVCGLCKICGNHTTLPDTITVKNATNLNAVVKAVNHGVDFSNVVVSLANDIDMSDVEDFAVIGNSESHPFRGTFTGNCHRIKNLKVSKDQNIASLFGYVKGKAVIQDLITDSTCSFVSKSITHPTTAFVAYAMKGGDKDSIIIQHCVNEAYVHGVQRVAAFVGINSGNVYLRDCGNIGTIEGKRLAAVFVTKHNDAVTCLKNVWNWGYIVGAGHSDTMAHLDDDDLSGLNWFSLTCWHPAAIEYDFGLGITLSRTRNGYLCKELIMTKDWPDCVTSSMTWDYMRGLNTDKTSCWGQNLGTDLTPQLNYKGLYHERTMGDNTWGTVILPYVIHSNESVQLYNVKAFETVDEKARLVLTPVDQVEANTPCFFKKLKPLRESVCFQMRDTTEYKEPDANSNYLIWKDTGVDGWQLAGVYFDVPSLTNAYCMDSEMMVYADDGESVELPAYHACLIYDGGTLSDSKSYAIVVDGEDDTTQVGEITPDRRIHFYDDHIYDLQGRSLTEPRKNHINIIGGHKTFVR